MAPRTTSRLALLTATALAALTAAAPALSQQRVGVTSAVNQRTDVERPAGRRTVVIGDNVLFNDQVITANEGLAQILFVDGSAFTIASNSRVVIDEFVFNPADGSGSLTSELTQGALRFVGGKLSKNGGQVRFRTPTGTLGVRGGIVNIDLAPACMTDGRCPSATASLVFGDELVLNPDGNGPRSRIYDNGYSFAFFNGASSVEIVPTALLDQSRLQARLSGSAGQSGGADEIPTDDDVLRSAIPDVNSLLQPVTVLPRPRPTLLRSPYAPEPDDVGITRTTDALDNTIVESAASDFERTQVEIPIIDDKGELVLLATPGYAALDEVDDPAEMTIVTPAGIDGPFTFVQNAAGEVVAIRTPGGTELPFGTEEPSNTAFRLRTNSLGFNEGGAARGVAQRRADGFAFYYLQPDSRDGAFDQVMYAGFGGVATPAATFFPEGEAAALVRTYALDADLQRVNQGVPTRLALLNPLVAREFAGSLGDAAATDLLVVDAPDRSADPGAMIAGLLIDGLGESQRSVVSIGTGAITMLEASDYETGGPSFIGSRRGSYRVGSATAAATMKGELGSVSLDTFGDKKADMFGESGETFVLTSAGSLDGEDSGLFYDDQPGEGRLSEGQRRSSTVVLANLQEQQYLSEYNRASAEYRGYASGMIETAGASGVAYSSETVGDFTISFDAESSTVGGSIEVANAERGDSLFIPFGGFAGDGESGRSQYLDGDTYGAIEGADAATLTSSSGAVSTPSKGTTPSTYVVPSTVAPQPQLFAAAGVEECECSFMEWGWWGTQTDFRTSEGRRRDTAHLGTWAAGDVTRRVDLPTTGTASFSGHAVGNVTSTTETGTARYVAVGGVDMRFDFGQRSGDIQFNNFDGRNFGGDVALRNTARDVNQFGGGLSGSGLSGNVVGSFVNGPRRPAQGVIGGFNVGGEGYRATGSFVGQR